MPADQMRDLAKSATSKGPAERFTGDVWVDVITGGARDGTATLATVHFSPRRADGVAYA